MKRTAMLTLSIFAAALLIAAQEPVDQVGASEARSGQTVSQIISAAEVDQPIRPDAQAAAPDQLADRRQPAQPGEQLVPDGSESRRAPPQLTTGPKTAAAPEALSRREEGRITRTVPVNGKDRCDPAAQASVGGKACSRIIETRAGEFVHDDPLALSPEQKLLRDQPIELSRSVELAPRRVAQSGEPENETEQSVAIAGVMLNRDNPAPAVDTAATPDARLEAALTAIQVLTGSPTSK
jgi:hypothetical protein